MNDVKAIFKRKSYNECNNKLITILVFYLLLQ